MPTQELSGSPPWPIQVCSNRYELPAFSSFLFRVKSQQAAAAKKQQLPFNIRHRFLFILPPSKGGEQTGKVTPSAIFAARPIHSEIQKEGSEMIAVLLSVPKMIVKEGFSTLSPLCETSLAIGTRKQKPRLGKRL